MSPFDLTGKLAVVTGARRGIGRAMAGENQSFDDMDGFAIADLR